MVLYLKQVVCTCAVCPFERQKWINEDRIEESNLFSPVWGRFTAGLQAQQFPLWTTTIFRRTQLAFQATRVYDRAKKVLTAHLHTLYSQDSLTKRSWKQLFAVWKTTALHCWTPRTTSDAIHSRHRLMVWKNAVFKKKALQLAGKLFSWSLVPIQAVQEEPHQAGIAFQKALKFRTARIAFKSSSTTGLFAKWKSPRNEPGWLSSSSGNLKLPKDVVKKKLYEALESSPGVASTSEDLAHKTCSPSASISDFICRWSSCTALHSTCACKAISYMAWLLLTASKTSPTTLCCLHCLFFTSRFSAGPWYQICSCPIKKASVWHSRENVLCCVHVCIYNTKGSSSSCSRKKIVARRGAGHLAPAQNIWTTSAMGLCTFDIPGSNITINSVNSIYRMSFVLVIQCKWYQNTAKS